MDQLRRTLPTLIALLLSYLICFKIDLGLDWIAKGICVLIIFGAVYSVAARLQRGREDADASSSENP